MAGTDSFDKSNNSPMGGRWVLALGLIVFVLGQGFSPWAKDVSPVEEALWASVPATAANLPPSKVKPKHSGVGSTKLARAKASGLAPVPVLLSEIGVGVEKKSSFSMAKLAAWRLVLGGLPLALLLLLLWHWLSLTRVSGRARHFGFGVAAVASPLLLLSSLATGAMWAALALALATFLVSPTAPTSTLQHRLRHPAVFVALPLAAVFIAPGLWPAAMVMGLVAWRYLPKPLGVLPVLLVLAAVFVQDALLSAPGLLFRGGLGVDGVSGLLLTVPVLFMGAFVPGKSSRAPRLAIVLLVVTALLDLRTLSVTHLWGVTLLPAVPAIAVRIAEAIDRSKQPWVWVGLSLYQAFAFVVATVVWPFDAKVPDVLGNVVFPLLGDGWISPNVLSEVGVPSAILLVAAGGTVAAALLQPVFLMRPWERRAQGVVAALLTMTLCLGGVSSLKKRSGSAKRFRHQIEETYALDVNAQPHFKRVPRGHHAQTLLDVLERSDLRLRAGPAAIKGGDEKETVCEKMRGATKARTCRGKSRRLRFSVESLRFKKKAEVGLRLPIRKKGGESEMRIPGGVLTGRTALRFAIPDKHWRDARGKPIQVSVKVGGRPALTGKVSPDGWVANLSRPIDQNEGVTILVKSTEGEHMAFLMATSAP